MSVEVFKIMHGLVNIELDQFFKLESNVHEHDLRRHNLSIWKPPDSFKIAVKTYIIGSTNS